MSWRDFSKHIRHLSPTEQQNVQDAFELGERSHAGQTRESGLPFFTHPVAVAQYLALLNADAETLIAALLHDTVEDTPVTLEQVRERFGDSVATLILGLTKLEEQDLVNHPSLDEKIESLRRMFTVMEKDIRIMTVKLADRLHNMQTIGFRSPEKQRTVAKETLDIYVKIADRLCMRDLRDEMAFLCHAVLEPELHDALLQMRERNRKRFVSIALAMREQLKMHATSLITELLYEPKSWEGLHIQYELEKESPRSTLLLNAVFLCESVEDCYRMLGTIHQAWPRIVLTFDDFINVPAINGYRGLQTTVILEDGTHLRCKIRTHGMHAYARRGIATVCFDQNAHGIMHYLPWTRHIAPLTKDSHDRSAAFWDTLQSDILSEAFIIYGNEHRSALVPVNATALDGALYLYPETAVYLTDIFVNGKKVPLSHTLMRADVLEIATSTEKQVNREWLSWSNTGIGSVMIRKSLSDEDWSVKIATGKQLLQEYLLSRHRGYLSELNADSLAATLQKRGLSSDLNKLYAQIAEGRLLPQDLERALYPASPEKTQRASVWVLRCRTLATEWTAISQVLQDYELLSIRAQRDAHSQMSSMKIVCRMTAQEVQDLEGALDRAGVREIDLRSASFPTSLLVSLIILLWGLNPVVAKWLLMTGITPMTLVSLRMMTVGVGAAALFVLWKVLFRKQYAPIGRVNLLRIALTPTLLTIALAIFTYEALVSMPPSLHITIVRVSVLLIPLAHMLNRSRSGIIRIFSFILAGVGIAFLTLAESIGIWWGIIFSLLSLFSYVLYASSVERTLGEFHIGHRYPVLFFASGILMALFGLSIAPFIAWSTLTTVQMASAILYIVICVIVPHTLMYMLLNQRQLQTVSSYSFSESFIAIIAEVALLGIILQSWLYLFIIGALFLIYSLHKRRSELLPPMRLGYQEL